MNQSPMQECVYRELAAASVLGVLSLEERRVLDAHLVQTCHACQAELREAGELAADLGTAVEAGPDPGLRAKLLELAAVAPRTPGVLLRQQGLVIERSAELDWRPIAPGVEIKLLHADKEQRYNTVLMRLAPGARYHAHKHAAGEEIFVLSGTVTLAGGISVSAGDYCWADKDSVHEEAFSESGCTMLILASADNQRLA